MEKAEITKESVETKLSKGEELTPEETKFVMSAPSDEALAIAGATAEVKDESEEEFEDIDQEVKTEVKTEKKKEEEKEEEKEDTSNSKIKDDAAKAEKDKADADEKEEKSGESFDLTKEVDEAIDKTDSEVEDTIKDLSSREKGFFYSMLAAKRRMKRAEEDRDALKFERLKEKKAEEEAGKKEEKGPDEDLEDLLEGDDDDFISKADLKKVLSKMKPVQAKEEGISEEEALKLAERREKYLLEAQNDAMDVLDQRREAGEFMPNFKKTLDLGVDIIETNSEYVNKIRQAVKDKKNPALVAYDLIRSDPKFEHLYKGPKPKKKEDKSSEGKENLKKIEENSKKPKTSGAEGGGGSTLKDSQGNEYTLNSLISMSPMAFRKVPKEIREKFLKITS